MISNQGMNGLIQVFNCMLVDVIRTTMAVCDYSDCTDDCRNYLLQVSTECPVVFHDEVYLELWNSLIKICLTGH